MRTKQDRSPRKIPREKITGDHKEGNSLQELKTTEGISNKRTFTHTSFPSRKHNLSIISLVVAFLKSNLHKYVFQKSGYSDRTWKGL